MVTPARLRLRYLVELNMPVGQNLHQQFLPVAKAMLLAFPAAIV
jgi:hypothetical protein